MNLVDLTQYTTNKEKAEEYLREQEILKTFKECPYCQGTRINRVRRFKYKCYSCNHEWGVRRDSILGGLRVPFTKFLISIKLFEIDTSVREASKQLGLSYRVQHPHTHQESDSCYRCRSCCILWWDWNGWIIFWWKEKGKAWPWCRRKGSRIWYSRTRGEGYRWSGHRCPGETLLELAIKKVKRGSLIYTDKFRSYKGLVSYGFKHRRIDHGKKFANGKVYINGIEGFWSFAKERLLKYHGVDAQKFPLYLKELEFRYNHRDRDLFDDLIQLLVGYSSVAYNE